LPKEEVVEECTYVLAKITHLSLGEFSVFVVLIEVEL